MFGTYFMIAYKLALLYVLSNAKIIFIDRTGVEHDIPISTEHLLMFEKFREFYKTGNYEDQYTLVDTTMQSTPDSIQNTIKYATGGNTVLITSPQMFWEMAYFAYSYGLSGSYLKTFLGNMLRHGLLENKKRDEIIDFYSNNTTIYDKFSNVLKFLICMLLTTENGKNYTIFNKRLYAHIFKKKKLIDEIPEIFFDFETVVGYDNLDKEPFNSVEIYTGPTKDCELGEIRLGILHSLLGLLPNGNSISISLDSELGIIDHNVMNNHQLADRRNNVCGFTSLTKKIYLTNNEASTNMIERGKTKFMSVSFEKLGVNAEKNLSSSLLNLLVSVFPESAIIKIDINSISDLECVSNIRFRNLIFTGVYQQRIDINTFSFLYKSRISRITFNYQKNDNMGAFVKFVLPNIESLRSLRIVGCCDDWNLAMDVKDLNINTLIVDGSSFGANSTRKEQFYRTLLTSKTLKVLLVDIQQPGKIPFVSDGKIPFVNDKIVKRYIKLFRKVIAAAKSETVIEKVVLFYKGRIAKILEYSHGKGLLKEMYFI